MSAHKIISFQKFEDILLQYLLGSEVAIRKPEAILILALFIMTCFTHRKLLGVSH